MSNNFRDTFGFCGLHFSRVPGASVQSGCNTTAQANRRGKLLDQFLSQLNCLDGAQGRNRTTDTMIFSHCNLTFEIPLVFAGCVSAGSLARARPRGGWPVHIAPGAPVVRDSASRKKFVPAPCMRADFGTSLEPIAVLSLSPVQPPAKSRLDFNELGGGRTRCPTIATYQ
jgi:hypothetical protein